MAGGSLGKCRRPPVAVRHAPVFLAGARRPPPTSSLPRLPRHCRAPPAPAGPLDAAPVRPSDRKRPDRPLPRHTVLRPTGNHGCRHLLPPLSPLSAIKRAPRWKKGALHHPTRATAPALSSSSPFFFLGTETMAATAEEARCQ